MQFFITAIAIIVSDILLAAEHQLPIPSDPKAKYYVLEKGGTTSKPTLTIKRIDSSITSYSKRIFDCSGDTFKYLGTGNSLESLKASGPDPNMTPLVEGSVGWYEWRYACGK